MKAPTWGRVIGIIMIVLGSLGIFYQIYKIAMPAMMDIQQDMMSEITNEIEYNEEFNHEFENENIRMRPEKIFNTFQEKFMLTDSSKKWLPVFGMLGILFCIYYIIGGAMLLKAKPLNYKIALSAIGGTVALNLISYIVLFSGGTSLMLFGLLIYSFIGVLIDLALFIIFISSDKSKYGIHSVQQEIKNGGSNDNYQV